MTLSEVLGAAPQVPPKNRREVLAGPKATGHGSLRDAPLRLFDKHLGSDFDTTMLYELGGGHIGQLLAVMPEPRLGQAAMLGHRIERPRTTQVLWITAHILKKQFDRPACAGQRRVEFDVVAPKHLQHGNEQFVQKRRQAGYAATGTVCFNGLTYAFKAVTDIGTRRPDGLLVVAQQDRQFFQIALGHDDPIRPFPGLIRPAYAQIENEPVQTTRGDTRLSQPVRLPGAGNRQIPSPQ